MTLLPDIAHLLEDPQVGGGQAFTVVRKKTARHRGVETPLCTQTYAARGSVQPAEPMHLRMEAEGDHGEKWILVRTAFPLQSGRSDSAGSTLADEILYRDERYKVMRAEDFSAWQMHVAWAVRIAGEGEHEHSGG